MTNRPGTSLRPVSRYLERLALVILASIVLATPLGTAAQEGTPSSPGGAADASSLASLLSLTPQEIDGLVDPGSFDIHFSDFSAQLDAVGLEPPDSIDDARFDAWISEVGKSMVPPSDPATYLQYWRDDYGFDLLQADHVLQAGVAPHGFTLYRGRFDEQAIIQALENLDYQPVGTGEPTILSIRDDYAPDVQAPTAYKLAQMNFATILDDGTLVFAPALGIIESVVDVAQGNAPSFAEKPEIAALIASTPDNLASALIVDGVHLSGGNVVGGLAQELVEGTPDIDDMATRVAEETAALQEMPPIRHVLLGVTTGWSPAPRDEWSDAPEGTPLARSIAVAHMYQEDDALTAVPVIEERLATDTVPLSDTSFIELYPEWTVEAEAGSPLVLMELTLGETTSPLLIYQLFFSRSLGFLAW